MAETQPRTNDQIDKINEARKLQGHPALPYEITSTAAPAAAATTTPPADTIKKEGEEDEPEMTAEKQAAILEEQRITAEKEKEKLAKLNETAEAKIIRLENEKNEAVALSKKELTEEDKERIAKEFFGINDMSEIIKKADIKPEPTAQEIEKQKQQRENDKIAFALKEGKFSKTELQSFLADTSNPAELVFQQYLAEQLKEDDKLTEKEVREEFNEKYGVDAEQTSRQYKRGQTEIGVLADNLIRQKHGKIIGFEREYSQIESTQLSQKQVEQKIISEAPVYKKVVNEVYNELSDITVSFGDENYVVPIPPEMLAKQKELELDNDYAATRIKAGYSKEVVKEGAKMAFVYNNLSFIGEKLASAHLLKHGKGTHGIPPVGEKEKADAITTKRQENIKQYHGEFSTQKN